MNVSAWIVNPDTGSSREVLMQEPSRLSTFCPLWSPDASHLACESFGVTDPGLNGIYTIRSSDGGGLTRITSNPGGDDNPGDYSPDGKSLVFTRQQRPGGGPVHGEAQRHRAPAAHPPGHDPGH